MEHAKKREMKPPKKNIMQDLDPMWALQTVISLLVFLIRLFLTAVWKNIQYLMRKKKSISGKVIVITGTGRGLGRETALRLSRLGAYIACVDINTNTNEETVKLIRDEGGTAESFICNVAKSQQVEKLRQKVLEKFGSVDILLNNAAIIMFFKLNEMSYDDIRFMFEVNCMGPIFMTKAFIKDMIQRNSGHIAAISSVAASMSYPNTSLYSSTKAAVTRYFESVRAELDDNPSNKIKVTVVHPYGINTSADYVNWMVLKSPILEEDYAASKVVDAILYEKETVFIPSGVWMAKLLDALFGSYQFNLLTNLLGRVESPARSEVEQLPYSSILTDTIGTNQQTTN